MSKKNQWIEIVFYLQNINIQLIYNSPLAIERKYSVVFRVLWALVKLFSTKIIFAFLKTKIVLKYTVDDFELHFPSSNL